MSRQVTRLARIAGRELFLEFDHEPSRSVLVLGSGRGGTTWLAESLARRHGSRLVFEPFHPLWGPVRHKLRLFAHPTDSDPSFERAVLRVLSGRVRSPHVDQVLTTRLPRSRVVKDIHATNLLPWLHVHHPDLPMIFVVRHPIPTSLSRLRSSSFHGLGEYLETPVGREDAEDSPVAAWLPIYDAHREHPDPLVRLVAEWCIENVYPLSRLGDEGVALVFYETLVRSPVTELDRLAKLCRGALGPAARAPLSPEEARLPSAMDWFGTAAAAHRSGDWEKLLGGWTREVPRETVDRCLKVLAEFDLDSLYGDGPMPMRADLARQGSDGG